MKKIVLFAALFGALVSCKKSNSSNNNPHMTANINGAGKNFNATPPVAGKSETSGVVTDVIITGVLNPSTGESMILSIDNNASDKPIVAGTYTDTTSGFNVQAVYTVSLAEQYYGGTAITEEAAGASITVKNHLVIKITSIDDKVVKGTFTGDLFHSGDPSATATPMANGDFYAAFGN